MLNALQYRNDGENAPDFTPAQADFLAGPLTAESERVILDWCADYGLLGILSHRVLQVTLHPRRDTQDQYIQVGVGWRAVQREAKNPLTPLLKPQALVRPLRGTGIVTESLTATWGRFFPTSSMMSVRSFLIRDP
jgi:hypothetical protein